MKGDTGRGDEAMHQVQNFRVYVIADHGKGLSKIGMSINPERRAKEVLGVGVAKLHWQSDVLAEARLVEIMAQRRLADVHHAGEWFAATPDQCVDAVREAIRVVESGERPDWSRVPCPTFTSSAARHRASQKVPVNLSLTPELVQLLDDERRLHSYSGRPSLIATLIVEALRARRIARRRAQAKMAATEHMT